MAGCILSQLKPSQLYILRISASAFSTAKNVELLGLYPILKCLIRMFSILSLAM